MRPRVTSMVVVLCSLAGWLPAGASAARRPEPLVDLAPASTAFVDHVGPVSHGRLRALGSPPAAYVTADGLTVNVQFSKSYTPDPVIAQSYVDFLAGLPHGSELGRLKVYIAPPAEVQADCGGVDGTLACYDPSGELMTVPGEQTDPTDGSGVTTSYVLAHEYGHHVARNRDNTPFPALDFGPKYWSSAEQICLGTIDGHYFPGDEGSHYLSNPGEAWADTYAHLTYPDVGWQFTPLLKPTAASFAAARQDVLAPWSKPVTRVVRGRFTAGGPSVKAFGFTLHLDGSLRVVLHGPRAAQYDLALSSLGRPEGGTSAPGSQDRYFTRYACREVAAERVVLRVVRHRGSGPFTATITYAG